MSEIYELQQSGVSIIFPKKERRCTIQFEEPCPAMCFCFSKMSGLVNLVISKSFDRVSFLAHTIEPLEEFVRGSSKHSTDFTYHNGLTMTKSLGVQVFHLEERGYTLSSLDAKNVLVVDSRHFVYTGARDLVKLENDAFMMFSPIRENTSRCIAPEILAATSLPIPIHKNATYYSLALLTYRSLFQTMSSRLDMQMMFSIIDTSLYWFFIRCLQTKSENRVCLLI